MFFAYHTTSPIPTETIINHLNIAIEQVSDDMLSRIKALQAVDSSEAPDTNTTDPNHQHATLFQKHLHQFYLKSGASILIQDGQNMPKLLVPYKLSARYLYQAHDCISYTGVTHICEHLSSY